jgi:hypothetical protein
MMIMDEKTRSSLTRFFFSFAIRYKGLRTDGYPYRSGLNIAYAVHIQKEF